MEERNMPRRPRREKADDQPRNESLVYGKNPVTELLKLSLIHISEPTRRS